MQDNFATVVELADAMDSKSIVSDDVSVRVRPVAPIKRDCLGSLFLLVFGRGEEPKVRVNVCIYFGEYLN